MTRCASLRPGRPCVMQGVDSAEAAGLLQTEAAEDRKALQCYWSTGNAVCMYPVCKAAAPAYWYPCLKASSKSLPAAEDGGLYWCEPAKL